MAKEKVETSICDLRSYCHLVERFEGRLGSHLRWEQMELIDSLRQLGLVRLVHSLLLGDQLELERSLHRKIVVGLARIHRRLHLRLRIRLMRSLRRMVVVV